MNEKRKESQIEVHPKAQKRIFYGRDTSGHKALRKGRFSEQHRAYFLTICVKDYLPLLTGEVAKCFIEHLLRWQEDCQFALLAFVVMPHHFHLLGILTGEKPLSEVVRILKGRSAREINRLLKRRGELWQAAFYDHSVRRDENLEAIAHYIEENPIRWGLVEEPEQYPHSSAASEYAHRLLGWEWLEKGDTIWQKHV